MQARWERSKAWTSPAVPHILAVALRTVAVVLAFIVLWVLVALAVPSGAPLSPPGPIPGPGLDL